MFKTVQLLRNQFVESDGIIICGRKGQIVDVDEEDFEYLISHDLAQPYIIEEGKEKDEKPNKTDKPRLRTSDNINRGKKLSKSRRKPGRPKNSKSSTGSNRKNRKRDRSKND